MSARGSADTRHRARRALRRWALPVWALARRCRPARGTWLIFAGHEVGSELPHLPDSMRISVAALERRVRWALARGRVVTVREGLSLHAREEERRPLISFSFDDAYRGIATEAAPLLRRLGVRATLFVHTGTWTGEWLPWTDLYFALERALGAVPLARALAAELEPREALLAAAERSSYELKSVLHRGCDEERRDGALRALHERELGGAAGLARSIYLQPDELCAVEDVFEIASHGVRHRRHARLDAGAQRAEIQGARASLEGALGHPVEGFAYPFGRSADLPEADGALLLHSGHAYACTMIEGVNRRGSDPYRLRRWPLEELASESELSALVRGGLPRWLRR
ncbi:MAG: polysaccharide deacetylase family protein [Planctomycetes bacterium]|nr:polysaccharide deacetylase family protein [Planctomycetota bacterium]